MKIKLRLLKATSILTLLCFFVGELSLPSVAKAAVALPTDGEGLRLPPSFSLQIPVEFGKVEVLHQAPVSQKLPRTIIHIQEAHGNYSAQKNIENILHYLNKNYGTNLLLLEGNANKLNPEAVHFERDEESEVYNFLDELARESLVTGPELYFNKVKGSAYGIEDLDLYVQNGEQYADVILQKKETEKFLETLTMQIERLTSPYLSKDLRAFLKRVAIYEEDKTPFTNWLEELKGFAKKHLKQDLTNAWFQLEWPMLVRIFTLEKLEENLDLAAFKKERVVFLKKLAERHPERSEGSQRFFGFNPQNDEESFYLQIKSLLSQPLSQSAFPQNTNLLFEKMVAILPEDFDYKAYPNVNRFIGYLILRSELDGEALMREIENLQKNISEKLIQNEQEKEVVALLADYRLLKKLFALELTPEEYESIGGREGGMGNENEMLPLPTLYPLTPSRLVERLFKLNQEGLVKDLSLQPDTLNLKPVDELFHKALAFYELAKARDKAMLKNVENILQSQVSTLSSSGLTRGSRHNKSILDSRFRVNDMGVKYSRQPVVVVITGGFHSGPFESYFKNKNDNYVLITPNLSLEDRSEKNKYTEMMLEGFFKKSKTSTLRLPEALIGTDALPVQKQIKNRVRQKLSQKPQSSWTKQFSNRFPTVTLSSETRSNPVFRLDDISDFGIALGIVNDAIRQGLDVSGGDFDEDVVDNIVQTYAYPYWVRENMREFAQEFHSEASRFHPQIPSTADIQRFAQEGGDKERLLIEQARFGTAEEKEIISTGIELARNIKARLEHVSGVEFNGIENIKTMFIADKILAESSASGTIARSLKFHNAVLIKETATRPVSRSRDPGELPMMVTHELTHSVIPNKQLPGYYYEGLVQYLVERELAEAQIEIKSRPYELNIASIKIMVEALGERNVIRLAAGQLEAEDIGVEDLNTFLFLLHISEGDDDSLKYLLEHRSRRDVLEALMNIFIFKQFRLNRAIDDMSPEEDSDGTYAKLKKSIMYQLENAFDLLIQNSSKKEDIRRQILEKFPEAEKIEIDVELIYFSRGSSDILVRTVFEVEGEKYYKNYDYLTLEPRSADTYAMEEGEVSVVREDQIIHFDSLSEYSENSEVVSSISMDNHTIILNVQYLRFRGKPSAISRAFGKAFDDEGEIIVEREERNYQDLIRYFLADYVLPLLEYYKEDLDTETPFYAHDVAALEEMKSYLESEIEESGKIIAEADKAEAERVKRLNPDLGGEKERLRALIPQITRRKKVAQELNKAIDEAERLDPEVNLDWKFIYIGKEELERMGHNDESVLVDPKDPARQINLFNFFIPGARGPSLSDVVEAIRIARAMKEADNRSETRLNVNVNVKIAENYTERVVSFSAKRFGEEIYERIVVKVTGDLKPEVGKNFLESLPRRIQTQIPTLMGIAQSVDIGSENGEILHDLGVMQTLSFPRRRESSGSPTESFPPKDGSRLRFVADEDDNALEEIYTSAYLAAVLGLDYKVYADGTKEEAIDLMKALDEISARRGVREFIPSKHSKFSVTMVDGPASVTDLFARELSTKEETVSITSRTSVRRRIQPGHVRIFVKDSKNQYSVAGIAATLFNEILKKYLELHDEKTLQENDRARRLLKEIQILQAFLTAA